MGRRCLLLTIVAALAGCAGTTTPITPLSQARDALTRGLDAWKAGQPASAVATATPRIDFVDSDWIAKKKLADYAIKGDGTGQGTQTFEVTLTLAGQAAQDVKYMVLGSDPVQVYRDRDFERAMNMENNPTTTRPRSR